MKFSCIRGKFGEISTQCRQNPTISDGLEDSQLLESFQSF